MTTIGADPEFGLLEYGKKFRPACNFIPSKEQPKNFGCDGFSAIAELRPLPAHDPLRLVDNIRTALREGARHGWIPLKNEWRAGSMVGNQPIGGHIHFGVKKTDELIKSLDTYLAHTLALIENPEKARYRHQRFGGLGAVHEQPHGFEYRPPSSWLVSPEISAGILSLAFVVVNEALEGKLHNGHSLENVEFTHLNYDYLRDIHEGAKKEIVKLAGYKKYQPYIDYIYSLIRRRQTWNETADIRQTWGFVSRFEGLKSYAIEEPERVFERRVPLTPQGYANFSLFLDFNFKDTVLPEIHHKLHTLIEVRDDGFTPEYPLETPADPKLHFYGLKAEDGRPQIRINGRIPRSRKIASFLRERSYEVEVVRASEHRGVGLRADVRYDINESARISLFCALSASGITRLGRRERVIEYRLKGD
ncbi:MAG: hypothetical protein HWN51_02355 [Desulfobacterales bacterium]|nr:hypothetical protein [Desulfobacterales bacterium]